MTLFRTKGDGYIWDRPTTQGEMVQFIILFLQKKFGDSSFSVKVSQRFPEVAQALAYFLQKIFIWKFHPEPLEIPEVCSNVRRKSCVYHECLPIEVKSLRGGSGFSLLLAKPRSSTLQKPDNTTQTITPSNAKKTFYRLCSLSLVITV